MEKICKYELEIADEQKINIPAFSRILSVQAQHDKLCLWAVVETEMPLSEIEILIVGTGNECPEGCWDNPPIYNNKFLGTVQMHNGLVWHVFTRSYNA